jgi:hypothetical protein
MNMHCSTGRALAATCKHSPTDELQNGTGLIGLVPTVFGSMILAAVLGILVSNLMLPRVAHPALNPQFLIVQSSRMAALSAPQSRSQLRPSAAHRTFDRPVATVDGRE